MDNLKENLINYLQGMLDSYLYDKKLFGDDDHVVKHKFYEMIGAKEMAETLVREPVNLGKNGIVTIGF